MKNNRLIMKNINLFVFGRLKI